MTWIPVLVLCLLVIVSFKRIYFFKRWTSWQKITLYSALVYSITVVWLTFYPAGMAFFAGSYKPIKYFGNVAYNLVALKYFDGGFVENVLMTVPAGVYLRLAKPKLSLVQLIVWALLPGLAIECCQFISDMAVNLQRVVDIDDLCANTSGVLLGFVLLQLLERTSLKKLIIKLSLAN